jgi:hypothetical protein
MAAIPAPAGASGGKAKIPNAKEGKVVAGFTIQSLGPDGNYYIGSEGCKVCHESEYEGWRFTFHSTAVQDVKENPQAILADFSEEKLPFKREEVEYTIGSHWDQRYMKRIEDEYFVLPRLWAVQSKEWRKYSVWSWKKKPYSKYCAGCHVTYIDPVERTIGDEGIGCEACHGPGGLHAQGEGDTEEIVNPADLTIEKYNMICASCHVRGTDATGEYYYPVGYLPGGDLSENMVPLEKKEEETNRAAISRLFREWKEGKLDSAQARCEVCGISGQTNEIQDAGDDVMSFCFSCHNFRAKMQVHTHHANDVKLVCTDCHVPKAPEMKEKLEGDIHSYAYFTVHNTNCYDEQIEKACAVCHKDKPDARTWAMEVIESWRAPTIVDH